MRGVRHLARLGPHPVEDVVRPRAPLVQIGEQLRARPDPVSCHASAGYEEIEGEVGLRLRPGRTSRPRPCSPAIATTIEPAPGSRPSARVPRQRRRGVQPVTLRPNATSRLPTPGELAWRRVAGDLRLRPELNATQRSATQGPGRSWLASERSPRGLSDVGDADAAVPDRARAHGAGRSSALPTDALDLLAPTLSRGSVIAAYDVPPIAMKTAIVAMTFAYVSLSRMRRIIVLLLVVNTQSMPRSCAHRPDDLHADVPDVPGTYGNPASRGSRARKR